MITVPINDPICNTFSLEKKKFKSKCDLCMFNKYEQKLKYPMPKFTLNNASKFSLKKKKTQNLYK